MGSQRLRLVAGWICSAIPQRFHVTCWLTSSLDPDLAVTGISWFTGPKFSVVLLEVLSGLALFLSAIGIYGVLACAAAQRTREIAVRLALGTQRRDVLRIFLRQGVVLAVIGALIGTAGALALMRYLQSFLYGALRSAKSQIKSGIVFKLATNFLIVGA